jgi:TonB family protein
VNRAFILEVLLILAQALAFAQQPTNPPSNTGKEEGPTSGGNASGVIRSTPGTAQSDSGRPMRVRFSQGVSTGMLVKKVAPKYPEAARRGLIQGSVVLRAEIDTNGDVENLTLVSGHPALAAAAIDAVKQWKYKPYTLNGQPVKVETLVTVRFQLQGNSTAAGPPEVPWPQELKKYPGLLAEFGQLLKKVGDGVQFPAARGQSRLLPLLPESTVFYAAFPNFGDASHQALTIFQQEVKENSELRAWWEHVQLSSDGPKVEDSLERFYQLSQYLGDEIVVSGATEGRQDPSLLILAEVRKPGLKDFLERTAKELAGKSKPAVRVLDVQELATAKDAQTAQDLVILVRPDFVVGAHDVAALRSFNARLDRTSREFASTPFVQRLAQAYEGGTTLVAGADLQKILNRVPPGTDQNQKIFQRTGFADMKYLVWEHKSAAGQAASQLELSFTGPRHGVASWLAAPGPLGSLDFVSPKAVMAVSALLKNPAQIFDDIKDLSTASNPNAFAALAQMEEGLKLSLREDLLSRLGGEITLEMESLAPPAPVWKAILKANDPDGLQATLNTFLVAAKISALHSEEDGVTYHTLRIPPAHTFEIGYAFVDGYLVIASSHEMVTEAVRLHRTGESLARSKKFLASLPPGHSSEASAVLYEDPIAMAALSMRQVSPEMADSLSQAAAETTPAVICAYGEESAIREASRSGGVDAGAALVVAAIAIPNLLRARMAANEASAASMIRTVDTSQVMYSTTYPQKGYARDLATLGPDPRGAGAESADHASLIDATLGNAGCTAGTWCTKSGFRFSVEAVCKKQLCEEFIVVGTPVASTTGTRSFCSTSDGVVRFKTGPPLTSPVSVSECQSWSPLQ